MQSRGKLTRVDWTGVVCVAFLGACLGGMIATLKSSMIRSSPLRSCSGVYRGTRRPWPLPSAFIGSGAPPLPIPSLWAPAFRYS
jgi:hypothetical protein